MTETNTIKLLPCPECGKLCRGPKGLGVHRRNEHNICSADTRHKHKANDPGTAHLPVAELRHSDKVLAVGRLDDKQLVALNRGLEKYTDARWQRPENVGLQAVGRST